MVIKELVERVRSTISKMPMVITVLDTKLIGQMVVKILDMRSAMDMATGKAVTPSSTHMVKQERLIMLQIRLDSTLKFIPTKKVPVVKIQLMFHTMVTMDMGMGMVDTVDMDMEMEDMGMVDTVDMEDMDMGMMDTVDMGMVDTVDMEDMDMGMVDTVDMVTVMGIVDMAMEDTDIIKQSCKILKFSQILFLCSCLLTTLTICIIRLNLMTIKISSNVENRKKFLSKLKIEIYC